MQTYYYVLESKLSEEEPLEEVLRDPSLLNGKRN